MWIGHCTNVYKLYRRTDADPGTPPPHKRKTTCNATHAICHTCNATHAMQPMQCNPCNATHAMQPMQCNPCNATHAVQPMQCNPCNATHAMQHVQPMQYNPYAMRLMQCNSCTTIYAMQTMQCSKCSPCNATQVTQATHAIQHMQCNSCNSCNTCNPGGGTFFLLWGGGDFFGLAPPPGKNFCGPPYTLIYTNTPTHLQYKKRFKHREPPGSPPWILSTGATFLLRRHIYEVFRKMGSFVKPLHQQNGRHKLAPFYVESICYCKPYLYRCSYINFPLFKTLFFFHDTLDLRVNLDFEHFRWPPDLLMSL